MFNGGKVIAVYLSVLGLLTGCESADVIVQSLSSKFSQMQITSSLRIGIGDQTNFVVEGLCQASLGDLEIEISQNGNSYLLPGISCQNGLFNGVFSTLSLSEGTAQISVRSGSGLILTEQILVDLTAPQVSFSVTNLTYNTVSQPIFTVIANEPMNSFYPYLLRLYDGSTEVSSCDFVPTSPMPTEAQPLSTVSVQLSNCSVEGNFTIQSLAGVVSDTSGNLSPAGATSINLVVDLISPTLMVSNPSLVNSDYTLQIVASEPVTGLDPSRINLQNAALLSFNQMNATTYSLLLDPTSPGPVQFEALAGFLSDLNGNPSQSTSVAVTTYDPIPPTVSLSSYIRSGAIYTVTAVASEAFTGIDSSDFTCTNCTVQSVHSFSGLQFLVDIQPVSDGMIQVELRSNTFSDSAGNLNQMASILSWNHDSVSPSVTLSVFSGSNISNDAFELEVSFSEDVTGFDPTADLSSWGGSFNNFVQVDPRIYRFRFTPSVEGNFNLSVGPGVAQEMSGNLSLSSNSISLIYDTTEPTILSVNLITGNFSTWLRGNVFEVEVVFSEDVVGFELADLDLNLSPDVQVGAGIVTQINPRTYRFNFQDVSSSVEAVQKFRILRNGILDLAGNQLDSDSVDYEIWIDNRAPQLLGLNIPSNNIIEDLSLPNFTWSSISENGSGAAVALLRVGSSYGGEQFLTQRTVSSIGTQSQLLNGVQPGQSIFPQLTLRDDLGNERVFNLKSFRYLPPITFTGVYPQRITQNQTNSIRIEGTQFVPGTIQVNVGGQLCSNVNVISSTVLFCDSPALSAGSDVPVRIQRHESAALPERFINVVVSNPCEGVGFNELCPGTSNQLRSLGTIDVDGGGPLPPRHYVIENTCDVLTFSSGVAPCGSLFNTRDGVLGAWDVDIPFDITNVPNYDNVFPDPFFGSEMSALIYGNGGSRFVAVDYCRGKSVFGYNDWYLPTITELSAIAGLLDTRDKMNAAGFSDINPYWTSSESGVSLAWSLEINFVSGFNLISRADSKADQFVVRCVRSF